MITPTLDSLRIYLHILAVAVWVGGQFVLAGIVPSLRRSAPDALPVVAKRFAKVAWPAMILIVFTGAWGLGTMDASEQSSSYMATFGIKMLMVGIAIIATIIHSASTTKLAKALGGAVGLLASLLAAYAGILLAHVG
jgi:putative copper export protein